MSECLCGNRIPSDADETFHKSHEIRTECGVYTRAATTTKNTRCLEFDPNKSFCPKEEGNGRDERSSNHDTISRQIRTCKRMNRRYWWPQAIYCVRRRVHDDEWKFRMEFAVIESWDSDTVFGRRRGKKNEMFGAYEGIHMRDRWIEICVLWLWYNHH